MSPFWSKKRDRPTRYDDPDEAVARHLEALHQADVAGAPAPPSALNGLGDAYLDKEDVASAVDYWRQAAEAYAREGMHANAIGCLKKIRRHGHEEGDVGLLLGRSYAAKGLRADAVAELERYAERVRRLGSRRDAVDALHELVRVDPGNAVRREELAGLLIEDGQREKGMVELRAARTVYEERDDTAGIDRVRARIRELGGEPEASIAPASPKSPPRPEPPARPATEPERGAELEIEWTSYSGEPAEEEPPGEPETPVHEAESGADLEVDRDIDLRRAAGLDEAVAELEAAGGEREGAARNLLVAAENLRSEQRWGDAVRAYRELAELGAAKDEHFDDWIECARQTGRASEVLEALAVAARARLAWGDRLGARRTAEEMLLVDPQNVVAAEILERVGSALPRD